MLSFVINEMRLPLANQKGHRVVGWQCDVSYKEELIYKFPFEWILSLNSSSGRMMALNNWEALISNPSFIKHKSYNNVFGFILEDDERIKSKLNNFILNIFRYLK